MTIAAELETRIARSPDAVFAELAAVERYPTWLIASGIRRVDLVEPGTVAQGSRLRVDQLVAGRSATLEGMVTAFDPGRQFGFEARDDDGIRVTIDASLAADGAATVLRWSVKIGLPLRYRMFEGMVAPQVRRAVTLDLEALRRRLEAVAEA
jgi:uncharacterized protein YndB with AHSA1/START domain